MSRFALAETRWTIVPGSQSPAAFTFTLEMETDGPGLAEAGEDHLLPGKGDGGAQVQAAQQQLAKELAGTCTGLLVTVTSGRVSLC
jgi:hypothetical protein